MSRPANAHGVEPIPPLPARTRLRLATASSIDGLGAWLCGHGCTTMAVWMWRACRMI